jgi:transcriptional regulator with XRE-family HTH domain
MSELRKEIRAIRMMKGIKQSEVAGMLGMKQQSFSKIENGKTAISCEMADKIARYFGFLGRLEMTQFYEAHILRLTVSRAEV